MPSGRRACARRRGRYDPPLAPALHPRQALPRLRPASPCDLDLLLGAGVLVPRVRGVHRGIPGAHLHTHRARASSGRGALPMTADQGARLVRAALLLLAGAWALQAAL